MDPRTINGRRRQRTPLVDECRPSSTAYPSEEQTRRALCFAFFERILVGADGAVRADAREPFSQLVDAGLPVAARACRESMTDGSVSEAAENESGLPDGKPALLGSDSEPDQVLFSGQGFNLTLLVALGTQCAKIAALCDQVVREPGHLRQPSGSPRRRLRRLSEDQVIQLALNREAGAEIKELAERYGIDRSTVITHLHRAGVPGRRRQGRTLSADQVQAAGRLYASGVNLIEVGEAFDVDRRYLRKTLPAAGFALRPPGRQGGRES